jgi:hypothetical protein
MSSSSESRPRAEEISVVVQGPVYENLTARVLRSVREQLPGSELILSTWANSQIEGLEYDQLVLSDDPGGYQQPHDPRYFYNVNRQIVSSAAGLRAAGRRFAVKMRSDMLLRRTGFLDYFNRYPKRHLDYALFAQRVITPVGVNPERGCSLFMPNDWFSFGLTTDVLCLWELPLAPEPETSRYFGIHPEENRLGEADLNRFNPEQYIWVHCLSKKFRIPFRHNQDFSEEAIRVAELALANNIILLTSTEIGLETPRHGSPTSAWAASYSHVEWVRLYRRYCDPAARVPFDFARPFKALALKALALRERLTGRPGGVRPPARRLVLDWVDPSRQSC